MMPSEFRCRSGYNWQGGATLLLLVWNHFWHQKWSLLSSLLMPVLYFLFIIMALSPMMDSFDRGHYSMGYHEYALVGLMAMNLVTQMGGNDPSGVSGSKKWVVCYAYAKRHPTIVVYYP